VDGDELGGRIVSVLNRPDPFAALSGLTPPATMPMPVGAPDPQGATSEIGAGLMGPGGAAAPAPSGSGRNWNAIAQKALPMLMAVMAAKKGGPLAAAGLLEGVTSGLARKRQAEEEAHKLELQTIQSEQERQDRMAERQRQIGTQKATWLTNLQAKLAEIDDPVAFASMLELADKTGSAAFGFQPGEIKSSFQFPKERETQTVAREASDLLDKLKKTHGENLNGIITSNAVVTFRGKPTPIRDVMATAGVLATDDKGAPVMPAPKVDDSPEGSSDFGRYFADVLAAEEERLGRKLKPGERTSLREKAKKAYSALDNTPQNSTTAAINALRLENMQAQRNTQGLPPKVQSQVTAQASGFDRQPIVKRIQPMAEAVEFANSLDPNTKNPADDQALIYAFAKAMDPESVVREGEYATVQKYAQEWAATFRFSADRIFKSGPFLTPQARANMKRTIQQKYGAAKKQYDNVRGGFASRINRITGSSDGDGYLIDYAAGFPSLDAPPPPPPPPPTTGSRGAGPGPVTVGGYSVTVKKPGGGQ
jgi:hypothetical protein